MFDNLSLWPGPDYDFVGPWVSDTVSPPVIINKSTQIEFRILEISLFNFYNIMSTLGLHRWVQVLLLFVFRLLPLGVATADHPL